VDASAPEKDDRRRQPEKRQNAGAAEGQHTAVVRVTPENPEAFEVGIGAGMPAFAGEVRSEGAHHAGQRRVLILVEILAGGNPFHAGRQVGWLVYGVVENGVCRDDAGGGDQHEQDRRPRRFAYV
jgi:hypothetical protein